MTFFWGSGLLFFLSLAPGFSDRTVPGRGVPVRDFFDPGSPFPGRPDPGFPDPDPRNLVHLRGKARIPGFLALGPQKVGPDPRKPGKRPFSGVSTYVSALKSAGITGLYESPPPIGACLCLVWGRTFWRGVTNANAGGGSGAKRHKSHGGGISCNRSFSGTVRVSGGCFHFFPTPPEPGKTAVFPGSGPSPREFPVSGGPDPRFPGIPTFFGNPGVRTTFFGNPGVRTTFLGSWGSDPGSAAPEKVGAEASLGNFRVPQLSVLSSTLPYPHPVHPATAALRITAVFPLDS